MTSEIVAVVQDSSNLNGSVWRRSIEDEMSRLLDFAHGPCDSIPAETKMVSPQSIRNFWSRVTSWPRGYIYDIDNSAKYQRFISQTPALPKMLLSPPEDDLDILRGLWRQGVLTRRIMRRLGRDRTDARRAAQSGRYTP